MENLRLSMISMNSRVGDLEGNLRSILARLEETSGSDVVCLPEMCLTGYAMPSSVDHLLPVDSPYVGEILDASSGNGNVVSFGFGEEGGYISQMVVDSGRVCGVYRKTHLGEREAPVMKAGDELPVFETSRCAIGVQTCWESHFPEITTTCALKGADLILMPHASGLPVGKRRAKWDIMLPARAYDNTVFCAACNQFGDNGLGTVFCGGATVYGPRGDLIGERYDGEGVLTVDLDLSVLSSLRKREYASMKDLYFLNRRRPDIYFK